MRLPSEFFRRGTVLRLSSMLPLGLVMLFYCPLASAQKTLGELLDAGARKLTATEFKEELVQRLLVGPTGPGGDMEIIYASSGKVQGYARFAKGVSGGTTISGTWQMGEQEAVCTSFLVVGNYGAAGAANLLPRCQFWFKLGGKYFLVDSDWDRSATVLTRSFKQ